jgi:hypothetical protein
LHDLSGEATILTVEGDNAASRPDFTQKEWWWRQMDHSPISRCDVTLLQIEFDLITIGEFAG